jgi:hypothetical protein
MRSSTDGWPPIPRNTLRFGQPQIKLKKATWCRYSRCSRDGTRAERVLRSFHLETLALSVLDGVRISSFPSGARYVFDKARDKVDKKLADPAGYSDDVAAHVNTQEGIAKIVKRLEWAYDSAVKAELLEDDGRTEEAFDRWGSIFKGYFPTYN